MAEAAESGGSATVTETGTAEPEQRSLTLKLRKRKPDKKVEWSSDTVDNEHLGRRSSKCELGEMGLKMALKISQDGPKNDPKMALK
ncbi:hypothetical protein HGM15179_018046 [Zosterops borbonicus]|uniref:E3 ubiquitin-protein ligase PPP1R11 n=1 Tax=Zosterops borbonicus TaxID=364589 RepID=A0A8K1FZS3_9PASS|nr:hypothetical protein HGM15179_018046 [Zosterops borbonicus]